ncbi:chromosome partitioning protein ParA [Rhodococcus sp. SRB_17]|nr:chromosome partitioning protein ParA [Rhodococcus sp. SRB_17]
MSALAIDITGERTAVARGAGADEVELTADKGQSIHAVIAAYSCTHSVDVGVPVEVVVNEAGRTTYLTVTPDRKVSRSLQTGPIPVVADEVETAPVEAAPEPVTMSVDKTSQPQQPEVAEESGGEPEVAPVEVAAEPVTMSVAPIGHLPVSSDRPVHSDNQPTPVRAARGDNQARPVVKSRPQNGSPVVPPARPRMQPMSTRPATSVLAAPEITPGSSEPARSGLRGRLNAVLNLGLAPKPESAEMRQRAAVAAIAGPIPGFSIVTVANPKGGVGKTPIAVGLNAVIAQHRGAGSSVCADVAEVGGSLADRVSVPPRDGQDVLALVAAEATEPGSIRPSELSRYLARQPGGEDIVAGTFDGAGGGGLGYDDVDSLATVLSQHREILIADTGNNRLAGSWQWATSNAHVLVVPVPLRRDAAAAAHRMLLDLAATSHSDVLARTIVVITDGPGDAPMVETEAVDAFLELGVHKVLRMPFEPLFASGERIAPSQLRSTTAQSLTVVAGAVIDLIAHAAG